MSGQLPRSCASHLPPLECVTDAQCRLSKPARGAVCVYVASVGRGEGVCSQRGPLNPKCFSRRVGVLG